MRNLQWKCKPIPDAKACDALAKAINVSAPIARMLLQRGITNYEEAKDFFRPQLDQLHDPFLMQDMEKAVNRLSDAIANGEKILIYGDYDVDGTTSVAMMYLFLHDIYDQLEYYIPDRYAEGYGVSYKGIDYAIANGFTLLITLDCGIKAVEKIAYAAQNGLDVIVCDHHTPGSTLPPAYAVLDPKRSDCAYPYKELSGCGVGFKLLQAFCIQNGLEEETLFALLDLVAISIASDIVPITGENRILAYYGLQVINTHPRPGVDSLTQFAALENTITITNIVFGFAPRINAAGRLGDAKNAVKLLIAATKEDAESVGGDVNQHNIDRKELDSDITAEALASIADSQRLQHARSTVLYNEKWHKGVIGIVASRCIETYYRPTIILTKSNGKLAGSARSVEDYDVYEAIERCSHLLEQFGGHKYAAGLTLPEENLEPFIEAFEQSVAASITDEQLIPKINVDTELDLHQITWPFYNIIKQMEPFGPQNMQPVFVTKGVVDTGRSRVVGETHLKLSVAQPGGPVMDGIAFGMGEWYPSIAQGLPFDICYSIEENEFNGNTTLQLRVRDIKMA